MQTLKNADVPIPVDTYKAKTPHGYHYYFKYSPKVKTGTAILGKGVDIRGDGGYVVGPGSKVSSGEYRWIVHPSIFDDAELRDPPEWMYKESYSDSRISSEPRKLSTTIRNGERNDALASFAGYMFTKVGPFDAVLEATRVVNRLLCEEPLPDKEVVETVTSVERYHQNRPEGILIDRSLIRGRDDD